MSPEGPAALLAEVAVPIPIRRLFTYAVPEDLRGRVRVGSRVRVPFGARTIRGTVVTLPAPSPAAGVDVRPIGAVLDEAPSPTREILALSRFVSDYYLCSLGDAIDTALPPAAGSGRRDPRVARVPGANPDALPSRAVARRRALQRVPSDGTPVRIADLDARDRPAARALVRLGLLAEVGRPRVAGTGAAPTPPEPRLTPTPAQRDALARIEPSVRSGGFAPFLLFGATGSGKTEVYLRAAESALDAGRGVLYLVPEIGLTPLLMSRLRLRFGDRVEVLHSGLRRRERHEAWDRVRRGASRFVVGTRSAVFAPVEALGLIVVDEEHDGSYKQDETPRYNGRDLAVLRARERGTVVVLGSATPSLESFRHAEAGRYALVRLGGRVEDRPLPEVEIVDMRREYLEVGEVRPVSRALEDALRASVERGEQALVLRNRRGWSAALHCPACGERVRCPHCSVTLTFHRAARRLRCHACMTERRVPARCPACGGDDLRHLGEGSERIEAEIRTILPGARIERMDRDTVRGRGAHESLLRRFDRGEIDVLVGTQMIAKGHDFPRVTMVGVLSADQSLGLPDFRAAERTFQLLTQVAGRAGRGDRPGRVVLQAFDPEHPVLREALGHDYEAFYRREIDYRRTLRYPPFSALVQLVVADRDAGRAARGARILAEAIRAEGGGRLLVLGPGPAPVERLRDLWRHQILVRSAGRRRMVEAVDRALAATADRVPPRTVTVDVDPYSLL